MNKKFANVFIVDRNMVIALVFAGVCVFANVLVSFAGMNIVDKLLAAERLFIFIMLLITVVSYFKHEKNIMKCTIGATLGGTVAAELTTLLLKGVTAVNILGVIIPIVVLISHLIINSDHHSKPRKIIFNQIFLFITTLILLGLSCYSIFKYGWSRDFARALSIYLFYLASILVLVCIESKLDAFRILREKRGWIEK